MNGARQVHARALVDVTERRVDRIVGVVDFHGDLRRIEPVPLEVAADQVVELRPERAAAVDRRVRLRRARRAGAAVIRVGRRVHRRHPLATADELEQRVAARPGRRRIGRVVEEDAVVCDRKTASYCFRFSALMSAAL